MSAAQMQAETAQGFPPLKHFPVKTQVQMMKALRGNLSSLMNEPSRDQQLYQLMMHLEGTALQVLHMLPVKDKVTR